MKLGTVEFPVRLLMHRKFPRRDRQWILPFQPADFIVCRFFCTQGGEGSQATKTSTAGPASGRTTETVSAAHCADGTRLGQRHERGGPAAGVSSVAAGSRHWSSCLSELFRCGIAGCSAGRAATAWPGSGTKRGIFSLPDVSEKTIWDMACGAAGCGHANLAGPNVERAGMVCDYSAGR